MLNEQMKEMLLKWMDENPFIIKETQGLTVGIAYMTETDSNGDEVEVIVSILLDDDRFQLKIQTDKDDIYGKEQVIFKYEEFALTLIVNNNMDDVMSSIIEVLLERMGII